MKKIRELNDDWLNQHRNHCLTRWRHTEFREGELVGVLTEKCECVTCGGEMAQRVIAEGIERKDVVVTLTYYTDGDVKISMHRREAGWFSTIQSVSGTSKWHPEYWAWAQEDWPARSYPGFTVIEVKGSTEIIEHKKMEPIFHLLSEEQVQNVLRASNTFNK